jgi:hypothetical protein
LAIDEAEPSGSEVVTNEGDDFFVPGEGSISAQISGVDIFDALRAHQLTINNPVRANEQQLYSFNVADLPQAGVVIGGLMGGVDVHGDLHKKFNWGGTAGTGPVVDVPEMALSWTYKSDIELDTGVYSSMTVAIPQASGQLQPYANQGQTLVRTAIALNMLDLSGSEPITITLINDHASYAA